jgi:ammonia channel protein AmtB
VDKRHGVIHDGSGEVFGTQILGLASFLVWATFFGIIIFSPCSLCEKLKINENLQVIGLSSAKITGRGFVLSEKS